MVRLGEPGLLNTVQHLEFSQSVWHGRYYFFKSHYQFITQHIHTFSADLTPTIIESPRNLRLCGLHIIKHIIKMKSRLMEQFSRNHHVFKTRQKELVQPVFIKLNFIANKIYNLPSKQGIPNTQNHIYEHLEQLDSNSLAIIFNTLIETLILQKKSEQRECKVKQEGFFKMFEEGKISTSAEFLNIKIGPEQKALELKDVSIEKNIKSKRTFQVYFKGKRSFTVKFTSNDLFGEFTTHLLTQLDLYKSSPQPPLEPQLEKEKITSQNEINMLSGQLQQNENDQNLQQTPEEGELIFEGEGLRGYLCDSNRMVIHMVIRQGQVRSVANYLLKQREWNSAVKQETINILALNNFEVLRTFRKDSYLQLERHSLTKITAVCHAHSASLIEQDSQTISSNGLRCYVQCRTQLQKRSNGIHVKMGIQFQGKGYCSSRDSQRLMIRYYEDIKYFENNLRIYQLQAHKSDGLIEETTLRNPEVQKQRFLMDQLEKEELSSQMSRMVIDNEVIISKRFGSREDLQSLFNQLRPQGPTILPSVQYINLVLRGQNERSYLLSRFKQQNKNKFKEGLVDYDVRSLLQRGQYRVSKNKQLIFMNQKLKKQQKDSLIFVIKQIGSNFFSGKSVMNVSLPVDIFQSRSLLQRSAVSFGMAPDFLIPIAEKDPVTQMKNIVALIASIPTLQLLMQKPFNPILGQTFQAYIKGIPIYYEQISHHPPISAYYMTCPSFTLYGNLVPFADLSLNSAVGGNEGFVHILMKNGRHFVCCFPPCEIDGLVFGDRKFRASDKGYIYEKDLRLFAEFSIQQEKKGIYQSSEKLCAGDILGEIFKVTPQFMEKVSAKKSLKKFKGVSAKDIEQRLGSIKGVWFEDILVDGEIINRNIKVYPIQYPPIVLPSDSNYRSDVLYHRIGDLGSSQKAKESLEMRQRGDRKLRERGGK